MTAPAPITQSTAELMREMRRLEDLATAAAFAELDALSDADYLRSAVANLHGSPATKAERYHAARLLRMADGIADAALAAADAASQPPAAPAVAGEVAMPDPQHSVMDWNGDFGDALFTKAQLRAYGDARASQALARVPLTQDAILDMAEGVSLQFHDLLAFARAIEKAHGITAPTKGGAA